MDLTDVTPEKFFNKVTYASDTTPGTKLVISNGDFVVSAIALRLIISIENLLSKIEHTRLSLIK